MRKKSSYLLLSLLMSAALILASCSQGSTDTPAGAATNTPEEIRTQAPEPTAQPEPQPIELTDGIGRLVVLDEPAQRVVALAPSNIEILFAIGAGSQVVGREDFANYPPEVLELPSVGGSFGELNMEAILGLEPDLILAADITTVEQVQAFEEVGLTVFMLANPTTLDEMYENMRITAQLTGHIEEAQAAIEELENRVAAVLEIVSQAEDRPTVFYELDSTDPNAPWTAGSGTFIDTLITLAGGQNIGANFEGDWIQISSEEILSVDPNLIILGDFIWGVTPEDVAARAGWDTLTAVQNQQVLPFNDDLVSRPGPRLVDGLEQLARLIHPELFE
jgi:iron complex transport system substrate-binding protein